MENELIVIATLSSALLLSIGVIYALLTKRKLIPWTHTPLKTFKLLLNHKPDVFRSWEYADYVEVFAHDRRIVVVTNEIIKPNTIICVGGKNYYSKYLIVGTIEKPLANLYSLNVDYLGDDQPKKNMTISFTN